VLESLVDAFVTCFVVACKLFRIVILVVLAVEASSILHFVLELVQTVVAGLVLVPELGWIILLVVCAIGTFPILHLLCVVFGLFFHAILTFLVVVLEFVGIFGSGVAAIGAFSNLECLCFFGVILSLLVDAFIACFVIVPEEMDMFSSVVAAIGAFSNEAILLVELFLPLVAVVAYPIIQLDRVDIIDLATIRASLEIDIWNISKIIAAMAKI